MSVSEPFWAQSESCEWYTPERVIAAVVECMGGIDLDPAADPTRRVPAGAHFTREEDGLSRPWFGRVFLNPPYDRHRAPKRFAEKAVKEYHAGRVSEAVLLLGAGIDTEWFRLLVTACARWCIPVGRLQFVPGPGARQKKGSGNTRGTTLFYFGARPESFEMAFAAVGFVYLPPVAGAAKEQK